MKKSLILLSTCLILISCNPIQKNKINLPDYFWKLENFETPKVLVYETNRIDSICYNYYYFEKIGTNCLRITVYDHLFRKTLILTDEYKSDGVYLKSQEIKENYDSKTFSKTKINKGFIYPFLNQKQRMNIEDTFKNGNLTFIRKDEWAIDSMVSMNIGGEKVETLIANGNSIRTILDNGEKNQFNIELEIWYSKNIGITYIKEITPIGTIWDKYVRTITIEEFQKIRTR
jgi:hypothetical protein